MNRQARHSTGYVFDGAERTDDAHVVRAAIRKRHTGRNIAIVVAAVFIVLAGYAALLAHSASVVKRDLQQAVSVTQGADLGKLTNMAGDQNGSQDVASIAASVSQLQKYTTAARGQTDGLVWGIATKLPVIGGDFEATRIATDALDTLASRVVPSFADVAYQMQKNGITNSDGSFNVSTLTDVAKTIGSSNDELQKQVGALRQAPEPRIAQVRDDLQKGESALDSIATEIDGFSGMLNSLATLFGHEGTRNYLILSQTNAETQAAGGVVGSVGTLTVTDGKLTMGRFYSDSKFTLTPPVQSTDEVDKLYAISRLGVSYGGNINLASATPNFPAAALYAKEVWAQQTFGSDKVDGVLSFDTAALQSLVSITGNIKLSTGQTLTADNTAQYLSNQIYIDIPGQAEEDAFFEETAQRIIHDSFSGMNAAKAMGLVKVIPDLAKSRHMYIWSFDQADQEGLRKAGISGEFSNNAAEPVNGVYVNEMGWTKTDWYVQRHAKVAKTAVGKDGVASYHVTYTIYNGMKPDEVSTLPGYITGTFPIGMMSGLVDQAAASDDEKAVVKQALQNLTIPGVVGHSLAISEPAGGSVSNITITSDSPTQVEPVQSSFDKVEAGGVTYWTNLAALISPGATATLEYDVTTAPGAADLRFDQTPMAGAAQVEYTDETH